MKPRGITMVIRSLMGGGAERVMTDMANYWAERQWAITIITTEHPATDAYPLDCRVRRVWLPDKKFCVFPWNVRQLRDAIIDAGHDLVLSFMDRTNVAAIVACRHTGHRVVVMEQINPMAQKVPYLREMAVRLSYPHAAAVTVLTHNVKQEWATAFIPESRVHVIHNPVMPRHWDTDTVPAWLPERFLCCMGRLHPQKGFDRLFTILPQIFQRWPEYALVILGEGEERPRLERMAYELGFGDRLIMPGFVRSPHGILGRAELFLFPSRYEGFPNALMEAMALGCPVVSFDCPSGPCEVLQDGINGRLVPNGDMGAFAGATAEMLENPAARRAMGKKATAVQEFCHMDAVMARWERLLKSLRPAGKDQ